MDRISYPTNKKTNFDSRGLAHHRLRDDLPDLLDDIDEVPVGEVRVARRGPVSPMPEQLPDDGGVEKARPP